MLTCCDKMLLMEDFMSILKCEKLCKSFGKKEVLKNVTFEVNEGDILGFIGPNGAGKTTTIKLILGLQKISSGSVTINGLDIKKDFVKAIERVGAIVENPDLYMYLTGRENLKMIARLYHNIDAKRIDEVIAISGLGNRIDDNVSKYSLGMRQRLGIAAAIIHRPNLLILDEPTNGLDPEGIRELRDLLTKLAREEKMAILVSSHNLSELESFCNQICIIKNGVIIDKTSLTDLKREASNSKYILELDHIDGLKDIIDYSYEEISSKQISINIEREKIPDLIKILIANDYLLYQIVEDKASLEDAFLRKTGGNIID